MYLVFLKTWLVGAISCSSVGWPLDVLSCDCILNPGCYNEDDR
jgi:hypothetical protein